MNSTIFSLVLTSAAIVAQGPGEPPLGRYDLYHRDATFQYFELLPGNRYKAYDRADNKMVGEGEFRYDAAEKLVRWQSGRFKEVGYGGTYVTEDGGKKHVLVMGRTSRAYHKPK